MPGGPEGIDKGKQANLAHIKLDLPSEEHFNRMLEKSREGCSASLGDPKDTRAKAKVTLVVSPDLARKLECDP